MREKSVQGTYITNTAKTILKKEADRLGKKPATLASEILEKGLKKMGQEGRKREKQHASSQIFAN